MLIMERRKIVLLSVMAIHKMNNSLMNQSILKPSNVKQAIMNLNTMTRVTKIMYKRNKILMMTR